MSTLKFTDIELEIKDLSARARALDEEAGSDVLGGWGPFRRLKRGIRRTARRARSRFNAVRRSRRSRGHHTCKTRHEMAEQKALSR